MTASLLEQLIDALRVLPGVGSKSAQRMAYHLLERQRDGGLRLAEALAAAMAAGLASWWITAWWQNVDRDARKWTAFGLALRTVVLAFLMFAPLATLWMGAMESASHVLSGATGRLGDALAWVPAIAVYAVLFGLLLGAMPALCIEYFLCRRFLRQARGLDLEGAR